MQIKRDSQVGHSRSMNDRVFDFVVIGSGFGGSVSAMRLTEKGYSVLVLEKGKRFRDEDFARTNWNLPKYLFLPALRCFGILQISPFKDVLVMHGSGVGGGSLGYANVLMEPSKKLFDTPGWKHLANWEEILKPHYATARRMLGVARNPQFWPADKVLEGIASEIGQGDTFQATEGAVFFGEPGVEVPDPYFGGEGPRRKGCTHCSACMVGCRNNAKNTLVKNYLYFAEKWGAQIRAEAEVTDVRPLPPDEPDQARYEVVYKRSTAWFSHPEQHVRARNVVFSAGALGTMDLLFRCRDVTGSLNKISPTLGDRVRTNSESLLGVSSRDRENNYAEGLAITSIFHADPVTAVEPVHFPAGSSFLRFLAAPILEANGGILKRAFQILGHAIRHPLDFMRTYLAPGWAEYTTILLVMQTEDNHIRMRFERNPLTLFHRGLVSKTDAENQIPTRIEAGHEVARKFAQKTNGIPAGTINEVLLNVPMTAHILGGCPMGNDSSEGVVGIDCQVHNYPGLFVVDGSIMPGNPGINPSLSITALAEYAMSLVPGK